MVDCLQYAVNKEQEIPRIISMIFDNLKGEKESIITTFNKKMRTAKEIMKDYGLEVK